MGSRSRRGRSVAKARRQSRAKARDAASARAPLARRAHLAPLGEDRADVARRGDVERGMSSADALGRERDSRAARDSRHEEHASLSRAPLSMGSRPRRDRRGPPCSTAPPRRTGRRAGGRGTRPRRCRSCWRRRRSARCGRRPRRRGRSPPCSRSAPTATSVMSVTGMPSCSSSHAVSRAPWRYGPGLAGERRGRACPPRARRG